MTLEDLYMKEETITNCWIILRPKLISLIQKLLSILF